MCISLFWHSSKCFTASVLFSAKSTRFHGPHLPNFAACVNISCQYYSLLSVVICCMHLRRLPKCRLKKSSNNLQTDGAVFSSSKFINSSPEVRNKLTNVFKNRLVDSLISTERQLECSCKSKWGIYSEPRCTLISTSPVSKRFLIS